MEDMAMATTMSQPPPPPRRPPPPSSAPPKHKRKPPPPPPPPKDGTRGVKRAASPEGNGNNRPLKTVNRVVKSNRAPPPPPRRKITMKKPVILRDVNAFTKNYKVGQGTYGSVFVGADKKTGEIVALKRINTEQEENGFPITALREVKILKVLNHENIVTLKEIVTAKEGTEIPKNVFMVFEYHEYDLTGILETPEIRFTQDHVKSWSMQLLKGVHYMHVNKIVHRDLKASNLLINRKGVLVIADWGLARSWDESMKNLTNGVVTLWYRPIELLLGTKQYSTKIDMWSVGCIIAEMFRRSGLLKGTNEASQLDIIFNACGHPTNDLWPEIGKMCPLWRNHEPRSDEKSKPNRLSEVLRANLPYPAWMTPNAVRLISSLLALNPEKRWSAMESISADYFWDAPAVKNASQLNMRFGVDSVHEFSARQKHEQRRKQAQANGLKKK